MIIDIIGAGSLGMLLAGKLGASGTAVRVVARTRLQAERIASEGLHIRHADGSPDCSYKPMAADIEHYGICGWDHPDWVFLTVKQKDLTPALLAAVGRGTGEDAGIAAFQNGLGHMPGLIRTFGAHRVFAAITTEGAKRLSPVEAARTGIGWIMLGSVRPTPDAPQATRTDTAALLSYLVKAGFHAELSDRIETEQWNKLLINAVINPLTAVLGVRNGDLLRAEELRGLMAGLFAEGLSVAGRLAIPVADNLWEQVIHVCEATSENHSSMLQDIRAGRQTEIEWINGSLLREGEALGLPLPVNRTMFGLVKGLEAVGTLRGSRQSHDEGR